MSDPGSVAAASVVTTRGRAAHRWDRPWTRRQIVFGVAPVAAWAVAVQTGVLRHAGTIAVVGSWLGLYLWFALFPIVARRRLGAVAAVRGSWAIDLACAFLATVAMGLVVLLTGGGDGAHDGASYGGYGGGPAWTLALFGVGAVLVGPWCEEVFFRGFLLHALRRHAHASVAWLAQAFLFAAVHPYSAPTLVGVGAVGLVLAAVARIRPTLRAAWLAHGAFNALAFAFVVAAALRLAASGFLGVALELEHRADAQVARVVRVVDGGPAEGAGIAVGDVIVSIDGEPPGRDGFTTFLATHGPGTPVAVQLVRDGETLVRAVTLAERP